MKESCFLQNNKLMNREKRVWIHLHSQFYSSGFVCVNVWVGNPCKSLLVKSLSVGALHQPCSLTLFNRTAPTVLQLTVDHGQQVSSVLCKENTDYKCFKKILLSFYLHAKNDLKHDWAIKKFGSGFFKWKMCRNPEVSAQLLIPVNEKFPWWALTDQHYSIV